MSSFNGADYDHIFKLARALFLENTNRRLIRETALELMTMVEEVRGQTVSWPFLSKPYRDFLALLRAVRNPTNNVVRLR